MTKAWKPEWTQWKKDLTAKPREKEIEDNILKFLRECGFAFDKIYQAGTYDEKKGIYRTPGKNFTPGISDIIGLLPNGRFVAIEVKAKNGRPSKEQLAYISKVHENTGIAFIARSVRQVYDQLHCFYDMSPFQYILRKYEFIENSQNQ